MIWSILIASGAGFLTAAIFSAVFTWRLSSRLYHVECDLAGLMDQHLRTVRRAAAKERWDGQDELDLKIEETAKSLPKKKEWTKWPSSDQSVNS